jgi:hypothetical protein
MFADFIGDSPSLRLTINEIYRSAADSAGDMLDQGAFLPHERPASVLLRTVPAGVMSFR